jgi:hypothetical protein
MSTLEEFSTQEGKFAVNSIALKDRLYELTRDLFLVFTKQTNSKSSQLFSDFSTIENDEFKQSINQIVHFFEENALKIPRSLKPYVETIENRTGEYQEMMDQIKNYPLKRISNQIKIEAKEKGVDKKKIRKFLNEVNKAVIKIVFTFSKNFEEETLDKLIEQELQKINTQYYLDNPGLQFLNPDKYKQYKTLIKNAILAYCHDFKAYVKKESSCYKVIEQFFSKLMDKIELLDQQYNQVLSEKSINPTTEKKSIPFPTHIFKHQEAFFLFTEYAEAADKPEDIGFAFRQMSEVEVPQLIMAKETVFRKWFNGESGHQLELNSAIKTLDRMGNTKLKQNLYRLIKEKYNFNKGDKNKAA